MRACKTISKWQKMKDKCKGMNGFPFVFTRNSLEEAANKFIEIHGCDYDTYCNNRCYNQGIIVEELTTHIFDKLSQVFTEFDPFLKIANLYFFLKLNLI